MLLEALELLQSAGQDEDTFVTDFSIYKIIYILTVYTPLIIATFLLSQEYLGEKIACFAPENFTDPQADTLKEFCWNTGFWVSENTKWTRSIYTQPHRYYPLYLPLQAVVFMTPIILWNILTKSKTLAVLRGTEEFLEDLLELVTKGNTEDTKVAERAKQLIKQFHNTCVSAARGSALAQYVVMRLSIELTMLLCMLFLQFRIYNNRLACQYRDLLCSHLELGVMLSSLATDMCSSYDYLFQLVPSSQNSGGGDERAFLKTVKVLGFQMKVLLMLVKEFDGYLDTSVKDLYKLILHLQKNVPPSLKSAKVPTQYTEELQRQVTTAVEPLISHLLSNTHFATCVTAKQQDMECDVHLPWCLTTVAILDMLPACSDEVQSDWICPKLYPEDVSRHDIVNTVFAASSKCYLELNTPVHLPGVMCQGKPQREVSLYEHICTRLCAFVAAYPAQHFTALEQTLLQYILDRNTHSAMLAIDIWSFLARFGTADLCRDHCHFLASLLCKVPLNNSPQCSHLVVLLRRMVRFMAKEHQEDFVQSFPVCDNMCLWSILPLAVFTPSIGKSIVEQLIPCGTRTLHNWLSSSCRTAEDTLKLQESLRCLCNIYQNSSLVERNITEPQHRLLVDKCLSLWDCLTVDAVAAYHVLGSVMCQLLNLTSNLVPLMDSKQIWKVLSCLCPILAGSCKDSIKIVVLTLLAGLGTKTLPPSFEQTQILSELPRMFTALLSDSNCMIHQRALETFASFAEQTAHESVVTDSLQADPKLQDTVVNYLNQVANGVQGQPPTDCLPEQREVVTTYCSASSRKLYPVAPWEDRSKLNSESQPAAKKLKTSGNEGAGGTCESRDVEFREVLPQLQNNIGQLTSLRQSGPFPTWLVQELKTIQQQLDELV